MRAAAHRKSVLCKPTLIARDARTHYHKRITSSGKIRKTGVPMDFPRFNCKAIYRPKRRIQRCILSSITGIVCLWVGGAGAIPAARHDTTAPAAAAVLGACPSNGRDCDGSEMSRMRGGGSSRLLIMSLRDPTTKQTGHFRPTRRAACFLAPLRGAAPRSTIRVRYAIVAAS